VNQILNVKSLTLTGDKQKLKIEKIEV